MLHPFRIVYNKKKDDGGEKKGNHRITSPMERGIESVYGVCTCDRVLFWGYCLDDDMITNEVISTKALCMTIA